ncbi:MAG: hypothetical protein LBK00_00545 [Treponema sp.]|jgi:hypothetical protein|nr:hypothetical protein [Treponema sp.]
MSFLTCRFPGNATTYALQPLRPKGNPRFTHLTIAGLQVYREGFTQKSRAMKRVNHIYTKNPHLDD